MYRRTLLKAVVASAALLPLAGASVAQERFITVASTTSTVNSALFEAILPAFTEASGIEVRVLSQGTGQALETGRRGDADVVFVHSRPAEERFVADGHGVARIPVMYNDFVVVGPQADPAGIAGGSDAVAAFAAIAQAQAAFASRGDDSGTHQAETRLWEAAGVAPEGSWYRETGSGMGATLNIAAQMPAYALTDRGTWLAFENKADLEIVVEGDRRLFNQYGVILVSPERHAHVKTEDAQTFIDWLVSPEGQGAIADHTIDGEPLFFPNADEPGA
ncbi:substrate-binding domain-containing protein [Salinarimonas chemoclinalis]|uniref:substrate-binding domain-containing protein n=1 Tax=Salinarimonas chemoclinalis TaxID=3241599 RepID=UPI00355904B1